MGIVIFFGSFSFLDNYSRFIDKPLPSWSASDVDEFVASDPVHGPTVTLSLSLSLSLYYSFLFWDFTFRRVFDLAFCFTLWIRFVLFLALLIFFVGFSRLFLPFV
jgi:hypothetical protein